jgi:hypothetical protein
MRASSPLAIFLVAVVGALSSCGPLDTSHIATGHFSGNKTIALDLGYGGNSSALGVVAYADVTDGTPGVVELTGAQHWRCQGQFRTHQSERGLFPWDIENLPAFMPPTTSYPVLNFFVPPGSYTVTVRIPAFQAQLKESATLKQGSGPNPTTGLIKSDPGCAPVAAAPDRKR